MKTRDTVLILAVGVFLILLTWWMLFNSSPVGPLALIILPIAAVVSIIGKRQERRRQPMERDDDDEVTDAIGHTFTESGVHGERSPISTRDVLMQAHDYSLGPSMSPDELPGCGAHIHTNHNANL